MNLSKPSGGLALVERREEIARIIAPGCLDEENIVKYGGWARMNSALRKADAILSAVSQREGGDSSVELEPFGQERGEPWPGKPPTARALAECIADLATNDRMGLIQRVMFILRRDRATVRIKHEARVQAAEAALAALRDSSAQSQPSGRRADALSAGLDAEPSAVCIIPNCGKRAPAAEPFCADHRDKPERKEP